MNFCMNCSSYKIGVEADAVHRGTRTTLRGHAATTQAGEASGDGATDAAPPTERADAQETAPARRAQGPAARREHQATGGDRRADL